MADNPSITLGRGIAAWLEGANRDIAINDQSQHALIVLTQSEFDKLDAFRRAGRDA
jgi:hypothetical protein